MKTPNDFFGTCDSHRIQQAVDHRENGIVIIPPRKPDAQSDRDYWLLDYAITLPENTTVILQNCKLKLSDQCRDNFFRSANCGLGIEDIEVLRNIHIRGEGQCILEGADHPRATGDGSKILMCPCPKLDGDILKYAPWVSEERRQSGKIEDWEDHHAHSYGTDALVEGESHYGDWRGIGILLARVEDFSIDNIKIVCSHGWGISLEDCAHGRVERIVFDANMSKMISGMLHNTENQDGIDLRNGCYDILINDISGGTGDDLVALTAIANRKVPVRPSGALKSTHVMHNDWTKRNPDIHDIVIRNLRGRSAGEHCWLLRMLPCESRIYNIVADGIVDAAPNHKAGGALLLGEPGGTYGEVMPDGLCNITVSNVISCGRTAITVLGYLRDSVITNVIHKNPDEAAIRVTRPAGLVNVLTSNILAASGKTIMEA